MAASVGALALAWSMQVAAGMPPFACGGPYVPPTDFDAAGNPMAMEFAVATAPSTAPKGLVDDLAREQLVSRLCRLADPASCAPLHAVVKPWALAKDGDRVCAMAVLRVADVEAWRNQLAPDLDAELRAALAFVVPPKSADAKESKGGLFGTKKKARAAVVVLGNVEDRGAPGGVRAEWLLSRVRTALTDLDVEMHDPPKGWDGLRLPKDMQLVLRGSLVERVDPKKQLPVLEISFTALDARGASRAARPFTIPAALAPQPPKPVTQPPPTAGLSLHVETRAGGSLCPGDFTQVHLTNESDDALYVRVFNLDANGEVLMLFPNESRADDLVPAGQSITLSADGFTVEGEPGGRERYVALAARSPDGLGAFRDVRGTCRFARKDAARLWNGQKLDAAFRATAGFTLLDDVRCKKAIALPDAALAAGALEQLPVCPPVD